MGEMLEHIITETWRTLADAKARRNWGGIGEFYLGYEDWPGAAHIEAVEEMRAEISNFFAEKNEPGIIIQIFPEEERLRVGVIRRSEND